MNLYKYFTILFFVACNLYSISIWNDLADYIPSCYKRFVFVICSRNNAKWVEQNLNSAFCQEYPRDKFRFIYVDDNSSDGTADLVSEYVTRCQEWDRFTLIRNQSWQSIMPNHYKAAHLCEDDEIIVHLDGDDFIKHNLVLHLLNKVYSYDDVWLTYGQYENWPVPELGFSVDVPIHIAEHNQFREMGFWYSHLRTFYAWLFKKIALKDLMWKGSFIPTTPNIDYLIMFPLIEMAGAHHYRFISDSIYLYNRTNSLSTCNMPIKIEIAPAREWQKYKPLDCAESNITADRISKSRASVLIIANEGPELADFKLRELPKIKKDQTTDVFVISKQDIKDFSSFVNSSLYEYCLLITDLSVSLPECDLDKCAYELERTAAQLFLFGLRKTSFKPCNESINYGPFPEAKIEYRLGILGNGIAAWQFEYEKYACDDPLLSSAILIRNENLKEIFRKNNFNHQLLKEGLLEIMNRKREIGLLFE